jgi:hypothetical protein
MPAEMILTVPPTTESIDHPPPPTVHSSSSPNTLSVLCFSRAAGSGAEAAPPDREAGRKLPTTPRQGAILVSKSGRLAVGGWMADWITYLAKQAVVKHQR